MLSPASNSCSLSEHPVCRMKQILPLWDTPAHVSSSHTFLTVSCFCPRHLWHHMWRHTGDPRGIPVARQTLHDFQRLQLRLVNGIKIRPENKTDWKHTHTITGKEKWSLLTRPPATPGIHSSPLLSCGALQKVELVWLSPPHIHWPTLSSTAGRN